MVRRVTDSWERRERVAAAADHTQQLAQIGIAVNRSAVNTTGQPGITLGFSIN